jgi:CRP/FNR family cyclic AMP-dependent transcriptional regulator
MIAATDVDLLLQRGWLSAQPGYFQESMLAIATWHDIAAGAAFNRGGDTSGGIWGIEHGQIDLASAVSTPDTPLADVYLPGQWGGIGPLFGQFRAADGIARRPTRVLYVAKPRLLELLGEHPGWWEHFGALAASFAFRYGGAVGDLLLRDASRRCIAVLLRLAGCRWNDDALPVTIVFTQDELAGAANMSRFPVGKLLRDLERRGLVAIGYRSMTIIDAARLRAIVDSD